MKDIIATEKAPAAIGPYSQGIRTGSLLFVSGQLPIDPATGTMADTVAAQTAQSLTKLKSILEAAGSSMARVVKTTVFLTDMASFSAMNEVYGAFFSEGTYPARSAVEVSALPKGALVEIEAVAEV